MQFRMIARRAPSGSITVLGDLAQATGPWTYSDWDEVRAHLPEAARPHHDELTLGYRAPGRVLDFASRLLPVAAPGVGPTSSIRPGRTEPSVLAVARDGEWSPLRWPRRGPSRPSHALVAVIAPEELLPALARLARQRRRRRAARARRDGSAHHHRPGAGRQGSRIRCRRGGRAGGHRRRGPPGPAAALRGHDPPDPAPERRARPPLPAPLVG